MGRARKMAEVTATTSGVLTTEVIDMLYFGTLGIQVVVDAGAGGAAEVTVTPTVSNDGETFVAITEDALTVSVSSADCKDLGEYNYRFVKFECTSDSGTAGTTIDWCIKG